MPYFFLNNASFWKSSYTKVKLTDGRHTFLCALVLCIQSWPLFTYGVMISTYFPNHLPSTVYFWNLEAIFFNASHLSTFLAKKKYETSLHKKAWWKHTCPKIILVFKVKHCLIFKEVSHVIIISQRRAFCAIDIMIRLHDEKFPFVHYKCVLYDDWEDFILFLSEKVCQVHNL